MASYSRSCPLSLILVLALSWGLLTGFTGVQSDFNARILAAQNRERAALGLGQLRWSDDLAAGAKKWSDTLSRTGQFAHSPNEPGEELLGENIWGGDPGAFSPEAMVALWVKEKRAFKFGVFPRTSTTGHVEDVSHYTQLIWRSTTEVGCALSEGAAEEILVCRYRHPGNIMGQYVY